MMRLIDGDALLKNIGKIPQLRGITYGRMKRAVEETPTVDAEPVVRCRDCKHWFGGECGRLVLSSADDYCSYGERVSMNGDA